MKHPGQRSLVLVGIVVLGFNLRPAAVSVGPVLDEVRAGLSMSAFETGLLTSLPVLAFAVFGAAAPAVAGRLGVHRTTFAALVSVVVGLGVRSVLHDPWAFLALSLVGLAGMATANVLLPTLVKAHFPDRVGLVTSLYTTALAVGLTLSSVTTVPVTHATGTWRWGLAVWALTAAVAAIPWLALLGHDTRLAPIRSLGLRRVARTRLGWAMAVVFALQSTQAYSIFGWFAQVYRDAGFSAGEAGLLLGVVTGVSIPLSFVVPALAGRRADHTALMLGLVACYPVGYLGLVVAPRGGAYLWAAVLGAGTSVFPLVLAQIGLRARTPEGTAALSGFTQSVGYLLAAPGPLLVGLVHDATGGWTAPLLGLTGISLLLGLVCLGVTRPRYLEDELVVD